MTEPSRVLHIRNVALNISEDDLLQLFQPFGAITKLLVLRGKNQALLQMRDISSAFNAVQFYTKSQPNIRGRNVYVQYSCHQELTAMGQNQEREDETKRILLVTVHQVMYPITVDVLHRVFSPYGYVEKIVTFHKTAGVQALIQYESFQSALAARSALQGCNIYDGCCQLDIQFSNLDYLQVNYNNDRSRDFTNPNLPTEPKGRPSQMGGDAAAIEAAFGRDLPPGITGTNERCTILVVNLNLDRVDEDKLFNLFSQYGNVMRVRILKNNIDHALVQMGNGFQAELAVHFLKDAMLFGKKLDVNFSKYPNIIRCADTREYMNSNLNRFNQIQNAAKAYRYCCSPTSVIHVSSLPQGITDQEIACLLMEHGIIMDCKVFDLDGKWQALVQFENKEEATEALVCKHAISLSGCTIRISFSQLKNI